MHKFGEVLLIKMEGAVLPSTFACHEVTDVPDALETLKKIA
jgi:hypothetical protein